MTIEQANDELIRASTVWKSFGSSPAVAGADLLVGAGESVAIVGASGSGKSTLLQLVAGIETPDDGEVFFDGQPISHWNDDARSGLRIRSFGFVFQFADLVPELTIAENIALPLELVGGSRAAVRDRVAELLDRLGIAHTADRRPAFVSGGERQRAAVGRAVVNRPKVVFADEPTGALDSRSREVVLDLLIETVRDIEGSLLLVTHDEHVASRCDRTLTMIDGVCS